MENEKKSGLKKKIGRPRGKTPTGGEAEKDKDASEDQAKEQRMDEIISNFKKSGGVLVAFSKDLKGETDKKIVCEGGAAVHVRNMSAVNAAEVMIHCLAHLLEDRSILEKMYVMDKIVKTLI